MIGIFAVGGIVVWIMVLLKLLLITPNEKYNLLHTLGTFLWFVIPFGLLIQSNIDSSEKHPCAQYGTQMRYDVALKTMRPMKVCILRGEWEDVKE